MPLFTRMGSRGPNGFPRIPVTMEIDDKPTIVMYEGQDYCDMIIVEIPDYACYETCNCAGHPRPVASNMTKIMSDYYEDETGIKFNDANLVDRTVVR